MILVIMDYEDVGALYHTDQTLEEVKAAFWETLSIPRIKWERFAQLSPELFGKRIPQTLLREFRKYIHETCELVPFSYI